MTEEYEAKFLEIDPVEIEKKLTKLGAEKAFDTVFRILIYDYPDLRLHQQGAWVRVRDEGNRCVMTFKQRLGIIGHKGEENDAGMEEYEVVISDLGQGAKILEKIGLTLKFAEEKRRVRYLLDETEFDIDHCPGLKPYLEIEGQSWAAVDEAITKLGLDPTKKRVFSTYQIYQLAGINMTEYKEFSLTKGLIRK